MELTESIEATESGEVTHEAPITHEAVLPVDVALEPATELPQSNAELLPSQGLLARRIAADAYECGGKDEKVFGELFMADHRLDNCEPDEITILYLVGVLWRSSWLVRGITHPTALTEEPAL